MYQNRQVTIIIPAHNEELALGTVLQDFLALSDENGQLPLADKIIVCDNASTDQTPNIVVQYGCTLVQEPALGYGAACLAALADEEPRDLIVFVDADCSAVATETIALLEQAVAGADLVIGSRTLGSAEKGALTPPQRWGNALASFLIRLFWQHSVTDLGPFRVVSQAALDIIDMKDRRFGWTVEMQIRALQEKLTVVEVPVTTLTRVGQSKVSGTVKGVFGASKGILSTLFTLLFHQYFQLRKKPLNDSNSA